MDKKEENKFQFVVGNKPEDLNACKSRRLKSHLSKRGWLAYRVSANMKTTTTSTTIEPAMGDQSREIRKRRRKKTQLTITYEYIPQPATQQQLLAQDMASSREVSRPTLTSLPPIEYQLGGGRIDPFSTYPGQRRPYIPAIIDHYISHMAVEIPELDQPGARGLLRSSWFPLVLSEPACFEVIVLLSASNFVTLNNLSGLADQLLQLKANAINFINGALAGEKYAPSQISDGIIGAVAKMASFEAMHGDMKSFQVHIEGLRRMVEMRGGLLNLGLNGLLRRIVIWIDLNSSFLLKTERIYPGQFFALEDDTEPNPAAFTAA